MTEAERIAHLERQIVDLTEEVTFWQSNFSVAFLLMAAFGSAAFALGYRLWIS